MHNVCIISGALLHVCPKIEASQVKKQKESSRIQGTEDKENKPAKMARCILVSIESREEVSDTDDDLVAQLAQEKNLSPRKVTFL